MYSYTHMGYVIKEEIIMSLVNNNNSTNIKHQPGSPANPANNQKNINFKANSTTNELNHNEIYNLDSSSSDETWGSKLKRGVNWVWDKICSVGSWIKDGFWGLVDWVKSIFKSDDSDDSDNNNSNNNTPDNCKGGVCSDKTTKTDSTTTVPLKHETENGTANSTTTKQLKKSVDNFIDTSAIPFNNALDNLANKFDPNNTENVTADSTNTTEDNGTANSTTTKQLKKNVDNFINTSAIPFNNVLDNLTNKFNLTNTENITLNSTNTLHISNNSVIH